MNALRRTTWGWLSIVCLALMLNAAAGALTPQAVDDAFTQLASYDDGRPNGPLVALEEHIARTSNDPAARARLAERLAALLAQERTSLAATKFVCEELRLIGGDAQVPALAALLPDPKKSALARFALDAIPGEAAAGALVAALDTTKGDELLGVIDSLGTRREKRVVDRLAELCEVPDDFARSASAAWALACHGTIEAAAALLAVKRLPFPYLHFCYLDCADRCAQNGLREEARALYEAVLSKGGPTTLRMGALRGLVVTAPDAALPALLEALRSNDASRQRHAAGLVAQLPQAVRAKVAAELPHLDPVAQAALIDALAMSGDRTAAAAIAALCASPDEAVRVAAVAALGKLGDAASVEKLATLAATDKSPVGQAARRSLSVLSAPGVDEKIAELAARGDPAVRIVAMRAMADRGAKDAVPLLLASSRDPEVGEAAVEILADWPDASVADELLKLSLTIEKPEQRATALGGYLRLALKAGDKSGSVLKKAVDAAKTDADKRVLLAAVAESDQAGALTIARAFLREPALEREAATAVLAIARKVGKQSAPEAEAALKEVMETVKADDVFQKAKAAIRDGWAEKLAPPPYAASVAAERKKEVAGKLQAGDTLVAYLDCGFATGADGTGGVLLRQVSGRAYRFAGMEDVVPPSCATIAFDAPRVDFEASGLAAGQAYALGCSWWDGDGGGRVESVVLSAPDGSAPVEALGPTPLPSGNAKRLPATVQLPLPAALTAKGAVRIGFVLRGGPNAVVSDMWLIATKEGSPSATKTIVSGGEAPPAPAVSLDPPATGTKVLLVTGIDYPGHPWRETAPRLKELLDKDPRFAVRIVEDPNAVGSPKLALWDVVIIHFQTWETPGPGPEARANLTRFVASGKGIVFTHFACGAWNGEWPEFKDLAGRAWDPKLRGHDPHGTFTVRIADPTHPITKGLAPFEVLDELYTCLAGDAPVHVVADAISKVDGKAYPMAFVLPFGKGRVFHSVLGHDARAYNEAVGALMRRGCAWAAGIEPK